MAARLIQPDVRFERTYRAAMVEFVDEGRDEELRLLPTHERFADFVEQLIDFSRGEGLPPGWVPGTTLWLVDNEQFVGKVEIRHRLTEELRLRGGHVGYSIRPTARRRGYGRMAMALALQPCLDLGLEHILVTCDTANAASRRIIERNGGVLEDVVQVPGRAHPTMRYWIDVRRALDAQRQRGRT